jgi:hypothetical protein
VAAYPPPPARRNFTWAWIISLVVVFLVGLGLGDLLGTMTHGTPGATVSSNNQTTQATQAAQATQVAQGAATQPASTQATQAPGSGAPTGSYHKIGEAVNVSGIWIVTVNSAQTSNGQGFDQPDPGKQYLVIDVSMRNISNQEQNVASDFLFTLRDSDGREISQAFVGFANPPEGKVEPGQQIRGDLVYQIDLNAHDFSLAFQADLFSSGQVFWNIHV